MCVQEKRILYFSGIHPLLALHDTGPRPKQVVFLGMLGQFVVYAKLSRCRLLQMGS